MLRGDILSCERGGATTGLNQWPSTAEPIARVMRRALAGAGLDADAVDVVYASANSSDGLDRIEGAGARPGLRRATRDRDVDQGSDRRVERCRSGRGCRRPLLCARAGCAPPIAGLTVPDAACAGLRLATRAEPAGPVALINSVASGGALTSIVLRAAA